MANKDIRKELERQLTEFESVAHTTNFGMDSRIPSGIALLVKAILRLDSTSSRLATVNIVLTTAIFIAAVVQIFLMTHAK